MNLNNKILEIKGDFWTSTGTGVPIDQSFSKNHNYFYTNANEVIQKLKFSLRYLVSRKNIIKIQPQLYQTQKNWNSMSKVFYFSYLAFFHISLAMLSILLNPYQNEHKWTWIHIRKMILQIPHVQQHNSPTKMKK